MESPVYDYSQPIVINSYASATVPAQSDQESAPALQQSAETSTTPAQDQSYQLFDQARTSFENGDAREALRLIEAALKLNSEDPVIHEFHALCFFALGDYSSAAAVLNAMLAVAPGWDWTTMIGLYGDQESRYTEELRNLESFGKTHPTDAAAHFVLAYHYLILGYEDAAVDALRIVTESEPDDVVAARMLQALTAEEDEGGEGENKSDSDAELSEPGDETSVESETTDLVGRWKSTPDDQISIELAISVDGNYRWITTPSTGEATTLSGQYTVEDQVLILKNDQEGDLVGQVSSLGTDRFRFIPAGAPPSVSGFLFERSE